MDEHKLNIQKALNKAYFFLKFRPRTRKEIVDYLTRKSKKFTYLTSDVIEETVRHLEEENLINDEDFTSRFIEQRNLYKHKGETALRQELMRLGITKDLLDDYFSQNPLNQEEQALQALQKKWYRFVPLDKRKRFQKAAAYLSRRGFSFDIIKKTIAEMEKER